MSNSNTIIKKVVQIIEEEIVLGVLHPRERLVEDELLSRFEIKRHVVRKILEELEMMGLVERRRNVGAIIKAYSAEEVEYLYSFRELLEVQAAKMITFPIPSDQLEALISIQERYDNAVENGDLRKIFRLNVLFHQSFFGLCSNPFLVSSIIDHAQRAHSIRASTMSSSDLIQQARQEHWLIIDTLKNGDREKLIELCRSHLTPSKEAYIRSVNLRNHFV